MNEKEKKKRFISSSSDHIDGYKSTVLQRWGYERKKKVMISINRKKESMFILEVRRWVEGEF